MSVPLHTTVTGIFQVFGNAALTGLSVPLLTTVSGDFQVGYNSTLTTLSAPMLTTVSAGFYFVGNAALTGLSVPLLTTVGGFGISDNPALETSLAQAVRDQLTTPPADTLICGNKNGSACPP